MHKELLSLPAALLLAGLACAQGSLWVDAANGSDLNPGTHAKPFKSISTGVKALSRGDTLYIAAGQYSASKTGEAFPIDITQTDVRLFGLGGADTTELDGENLPTAMMRFQPGATNVKLFGLALVGGLATPNWWDYAIQIDKAAVRIEIAGCRFSRINRGILVWGDTANPGVQRHKLHSNLFVQCYNDCINLFQPTATLCFNNTCYNTLHLGILVAGDNNNSQVFNNLLVKCREGITSDNNPPTTLIENNNCFNNGTNYRCPHYPAGVPASNLQIDPQFTDEAKADFTLKATSPMIGAGYMQTVAHYYAPDYDSAARLFDFDADGTAKVDIGCYEVQDAYTSYSGTFAAGQVVTIKQHGPIGYLALVLFALDVPGAALQPYGTILLDPFTLLPFQMLGSATASTPLSIPNNPALSGGIRLYFQTLFFNSVPVFKAGNLQLGVL